jgi:hypothetical protein
MRRGLLTGMVLLALGAMGCGLLEPTATSLSPRGVIPGEAVVGSIDILILESFPVQVHVVARGGFSVGNCIAIDQVTRERDGNTFQVTITTIQYADVVCTDEVVPWEEVIPLDVYGLPAGIYTVTVNGVGGTFELQVDNVLLEEPVEGSIGGVVWHDLCATPWGEPPPMPPEGCVELAGGGYEANGILEGGEPGIAGVVIELGAGACPGTELVATAVTDASGAYAFTGLGAGTYCVSVDALDATNETILIPGDWTHPAPGLGGETVVLGEGAVASDVNFGWDYQFLPGG